MVLTFYTHNFYVLKMEDLNLLLLFQCFHFYFFKMHPI